MRKISKARLSLLTALVFSSCVSWITGESVTERSKATRPDWMGISSDKFETYHGKLSLTYKSEPQLDLPLGLKRAQQESLERVLTRIGNLWTEDLKSKLGSRKMEFAGSQPEFAAIREKIMRSPETQKDIKVEDIYFEKYQRKDAPTIEEQNFYRVFTLMAVPANMTAPLNAELKFRLKNSSNPQLSELASLL